MENKVKCPWCHQEVSILESEHQGPYAKMVLRRCSSCHKLISGRVVGEPDEIIRKK